MSGPVRAAAMSAVLWLGWALTWLGTSRSLPLFFGGCVLAGVAGGLIATWSER